MKSVVEFDDEQLKDFRFICRDFGGPSSSAYVLDVLERCVFDLGQPDLDSQCFSSPDLLREFEVCMAALEYSRMQSAIESKDE